MIRLAHRIAVAAMELESRNCHASNTDTPDSATLVRSRISVIGNSLT